MAYALVFDSIPIAFVFVLVTSLLFFLAGKKAKKKAGDRATGAYCCGESLEAQELGVPAKGVYTTIIDCLGIKWLSDIHSGNLTEYLFMVSVAAFVIIAVLVLTWY